MKQSNLCVLSIRGKKFNAAIRSLTDDEFAEHGGTELIAVYCPVGMIGDQKVMVGERELLAKKWLADPVSAGIFNIIIDRAAAE
jgi:hypothetical protein